ncbi:MAG: hypothetical protein K8T90_15065 [Planctomycetes bacterium]|nr:hypothetical protein [Planctomycetota bacterium]
MSTGHEAEREFGRRDVMRLGVGAAAMIASVGLVVGKADDADAATLGPQPLKLSANNFRVRIGGVELRNPRSASFQRQLHAALEEPDGNRYTYTPQSAGDLDVVIAIPIMEVASVAVLDLWFDAYVSGSDAGSTRELAVEGTRGTGSGTATLRTWRAMVRPMRRESVPGVANATVALVRYTLRGTLTSID